MRAAPLLAGCAALAFAASASAFGQGTISLGSVQFERKAGCWSTSPAVNLRGVSANLNENHLFEFGWWFRVAGDSQETAFPPPDTEQYLGAQSVHTWNDVGGRGLFSAVERATIHDLDNGSPNAVVVVAMELHNLSASQGLGLELFNMVDFDLQPNGSDDTAHAVEWTPSLILELQDAGASFAQYTLRRTPGIGTHYLVRPYGASDVGAVLSDAAMTTFDDSGAPFGPGDFTAGGQFTPLLGPLTYKIVTVYLAVNYGSNCLDSTGIFCDGLERGNTSLWSPAAP